MPPAYVDPHFDVAPCDPTVNPVLRGVGRSLEERGRLCRHDESQRRIRRLASNEEDVDDEAVPRHGRRPTLRPMPYSVRSLVDKKLKDLRENPTHEHIVAETRMCMTLITQAVKALPNSSRRE